MTSKCIKESSKVTDKFLNKFNKFLEKEEYTDTQKFNVLTGVGLSLLYTALEMSPDVFYFAIQDELKLLITDNESFNSKYKESLLN